MKRREIDNRRPCTEHFQWKSLSRFLGYHSSIGLCAKESVRQNRVSFCENTGKLLRGTLADTHRIRRLKCSAIFLARIFKSITRFAKFDKWTPVWSSILLVIAVNRMVITIFVSPQAPVPFLLSLAKYLAAIIFEVPEVSPLITTTTNRSKTFTSNSKRWLSAALDGDLSFIAACLVNKRGTSNHVAVEFIRRCDPWCNSDD